MNFRTSTVFLSTPCNRFGYSIIYWEPVAEFICICKCSNVPDLQNIIWIIVEFLQMFVFCSFYFKWTTFISWTFLAPISSAGFNKCMALAPIVNKKLVSTLVIVFMKCATGNFFSVQILKWSKIWGSRTILVAWTAELLPQGILIRELDPIPKYLRYVTYFWGP